MGLLSFLGKLFPVVPEPLDALQYEVPKGWLTERLDGGVLLLAPELEENWQTNIHIEVRTDPEQRSASEAIEDLIPKLEHQHSAFRLLNQDQIRGEDDLRIARIEYKSTVDGVRLRQFQLIAQGPSEDMVFVECSSRLLHLELGGRPTALPRPNRKLNRPHWLPSPR